MKITSIAVIVFFCFVAGLLTERTQRIGLEVEALSDGRPVVYLPSPPTVLSGITLIAPSESIQYLDVPVFSIIENIEQYAIATEKLINKPV